VIPISTRLRGVLEMAKTDPEGKDYGPDAFVFGELGLPVGNIKRAWETAVLKAHGHTPIWQGTGLAPASRAALKVINLKFHDLRHEGASRLLEAGWPLHQVRDMLGHSTIQQTDTYLTAGKMSLHETMKRLDPSRCNPVVSEATIEQPTLHNGDEQTEREVTVN
jgi:integrase